MILPWGNKFDENRLHYSGDHSHKTAPVGNYPNGVSWVGALDMSGNVWEWTSSLKKDYPYVSSDGRELTENKERISGNITVRGGAFWYVYLIGRAALRYGASAYSGFGFRCAHL